MRLIKDYRVVSVPLGAGGGAHSFFVKAHRSQTQGEGEDTAGRALFVGNADYGFDRSLADVDGYLRQLFGAFGAVESVSVSAFEKDGRESRARFAHVTFLRKSSLQAALKADDSVYLEQGRGVAQFWGSAASVTTLSDVLTRYRWQGLEVDEARADADRYMEAFEEAEQLEKRELDRKTKSADEDGFVLVNNRKKRKRVEAGPKGAGGKKEKKSKELQNFYRFQMREQKQNKLVDLRKKFEEDKARVAHMKANRSFKPF